MPSKNTVSLWFNGQAEKAARFYAATFPDSSVGAVMRAPGDFPSPWNAPAAGARTGGACRGRSHRAS